MDDKTKKAIPEDFLWGASTSSHQVEGGNHNQWTVWELANASKMAKTAEERLGWLPNWEDVKKQAEDPGNYVSGKGVEHLSRYKEDFDLLPELNMNAFRFGIEWSRIEPEQGVWDQAAVEHYRSYIQELKKRGIEPVLNIWHWTVPVWFMEKGEFRRRSNLHFFDRFVQKIAEEYGRDLKFVITLNEPNVYIGQSYLAALWPPQEKNLLHALLIYKNLVNAHKRAYKILKKANPQTFVGIAMNLANSQPTKSTISNKVVVRLIDYFSNWWFLNRISNYQDFTGFNYYFTNYYGLSAGKKNPTSPVNDLGWYMEPDGVYEVIKQVANRYKKPIIITENGLADSDDKHRQWWLDKTIQAIEKANTEGANVIGYFHWSLLDNFEWAYGWWPKFGLVAVDRQNGMKRIVRGSGKWLSRRIRQLSE